MITIELPRALGVTLESGTAVRVDRACATVRDALAELGRYSEAALDRVMNECGEIREHVNIFVNNENIRFLDGLDSPVPDGSTVHVIAAISGG